MAISLRCPIVFMMFVSAFVGVKVNLSIKYESVNDQAKKPVNYFMIDISVGPKEGKFKSYKTTASYGAPCIQTNTRLVLIIPKEKKALLSSGFKLAFDSGKFEPKKTFDQEIDVIDEKKVCFLWGSWLPHFGNDNAEADVFLDFLTEKTDTNNRNMYLVNMEYRISDLYMRFELVPEFLGLTTNESRKIQEARTTHKFPLVTKYYQDKDWVLNVIYIRENQFKYFGRGQLFIPILADKDEEKEINEAFINHKKVCDKTPKDDESEYESALLKEWKGLTFIESNMLYKPVLPLEKQGKNQLVI